MTSIPIEQQFANVLPNAIIVLSQEGVILWWNKAAEKIFALTDRPNQHINDVISADYFAQYRVASQPKMFEMEIRADERIAISFVPYGDDKYLLIANDITHVHQLEIMRQDFVANVSHELRTPLTVIHGYLETLLHEETVDLEKRKKIYTQMYQQSLRMERLVTDLLLLSRLETENLQQENRREVNVPEITKAICHEANILSGKRQHQIHCKTDPKLFISGNEYELHSAFSNIVFNAVNYTPANGEIFVTWGYDEAKRPCFKVVDTGIGIAVHHIPRITERFYRVDKARSRASGGTGLGLAIVKHVLLRHQAQLRISSELGKGSTFMCIF